MNYKNLGLIWSSIKGVFRFHRNGQIESLIGHMPSGSKEGDRARSLIPSPNYPSDAELRAAARQEEGRIQKIGAGTSRLIG